MSQGLFLRDLTKLSVMISASIAMTPALAQSPSSFPLPAPVKAPAISVTTLKEVTKTLASDPFEGRAPTTAGEEKTISYLIAQMKKAGLRPGNKGQWTQDVPLVQLTPSPNTHLSITGGKQRLDFAYKTDLVATSYRVQPHIEVKNSEMVFVGFGITAPEKNWDDYAGVDVRGKTVVILINDPDYEMRSLDGPFGGRAMTYYGRWTYKFEEAARHGAAAALIIHDTFPAAYPWNVVVSSWTGPQLELDLPNGHMDATQANGWVTQEAAKAIFASAGKNYDKLASAAKQPGFKAVSLGMKANLAIDSDIKHQASRNVIGVLPGTSRKADYVLYSAHWDHLGHCEPVNGDDICNGALDNATGAAGLIALAKAQVKAGPAKRSMIFLAVTAEESGLLGSQYYAENPAYPLAQTVGGINMDGLNIFGPTRDVTIIGGGKSELEALLSRAVRAQGRTLQPEATPEKGSFYRSDHFSFAKRGVPMVYARSGDDMVYGGIAAGRTASDDYTNLRYHKPQDEYDPKWNWAGAVQDLQLYYQIGRELANSDAWPNWYDGAEFKASRDASRRRPQ